MQLEEASPVFIACYAGEKAAKRKRFFLLSPDMRRDDGLLGRHDVPRQRALEPAVGLHDQVAPRASQQNRQGRGEVRGSGHVLFCLST